MFTLHGSFGISNTHTRILEHQKNMNIKRTPAGESWGLPVFYQTNQQGNTKQSFLLHGTRPLGQMLIINVYIYRCIIQGEPYDTALRSSTKQSPIFLHLLSVTPKRTRRHEKKRLPKGFRVLFPDSSTPHTSSRFSDQRLSRCFALVERFAWRDVGFAMFLRRCGRRF